MPPTLVILTGVRRDERVVLQDDLILGRAEADLTIEDDSEISRQHVLLRARGDGFEIADLGSRNGTFINGTQLERRARLAHGDVIQVGQTKLRFELVEAPPPEPLAVDEGTRVSRAPEVRAPEVSKSVEIPAPVSAPRGKPAGTEPAPALPAAEPGDRQHAPIEPRPAVAQTTPTPFTVRQSRQPHRGVDSRQPAMLLFSIAMIVAANAGLLAYFWQRS